MKQPFFYSVKLVFSWREIKESASETMGNQFAELYNNQIWQRLIKSLNEDLEYQFQYVFGRTADNRFVSPNNNRSLN